jgi:hypothetical protein
MENIITSSDMENILDIVVNHVNSKQFIKDLANGMIAWFFTAMSGYTIDSEEARDISMKLGTKVMEYLDSVHRLLRTAGGTDKPFKDYFETEQEARRLGMSYILRTLRSADEKNFAFVAIMLLIALNRDEGEFESYRQTLPYLDIRILLTTFLREKAKKYTYKHLAA